MQTTGRMCLWCPLLAVLLTAFGQSASAETINFVWRGKDVDVPGSMASGQDWMKVEYPVQRGKGTVLIARQSVPKPDARIVLAANPTRSAQVAAAELRHYVEKMTGVELPVTTDGGRPFKGPKILVGESQLTRLLGLKSSDFSPQEHLIATYGNVLVLMGCDEQEYGVVDYEGNGLWPGFTTFYDWSLKPEWAKKVGTVYAVHDFLRQFCGVRWYLPGELGEVCPAKTQLAVSNQDVKSKPWSDYRAIYPPGILDPFHFIGSGRPRVRIGVRDLNLWLLRMKLIGCEAFYANHSLIAEWFKKRFPDKREFLAKGYEHPTQLCLTSKELIRIVNQDADDYFAGKTNYERSHGDYFCVMPHDTSQYCKCPGCQGLVRSEEEARGHGFWNDRASNYVWNFVNEIAKHVKTKHPGKWVSCCSYARYALVPDRVKLSGNVAVEICRVLVDGIKDPEYRPFYRQKIKRWANAAGRWYIWEYFDHIQGNYHGTSFPGIFLHEIADDIRFLEANGCRGLFNELSCTEGVLPNPAQDHLNLYVQLRLLDDASLDVDVLLDEYCRLFYGRAHEPMKAFFVRMEERFANPDNWQLQGEETDANWDRICPPSELREFEDLIDRASGLASQEPYSTRVRLIKEAVLGPMQKYCMRHFVFMKSAKRSLSVPFIKGGRGLTQAEGNHAARFYSIGGDTVQTKTEAWGGYDTKNLYVKVKCYENQMDKLKAVIKPNDPDRLHICQDDAIELFIDVGRTRKDYYQVLGNTIGAINAQKRFDGRCDPTYDSGAATRIEKAKDYWTITFTVPLGRLTNGVPIKKGDVWGFNICRDRDPASKGLPRSEMYTTWCPTGMHFHVPNRFGVLEFR